MFDSMILHATIPKREGDGRPFDVLVRVHPIELALCPCGAGSLLHRWPGADAGQGHVLGANASPADGLGKEGLPLFGD